MIFKVTKQYGRGPEAPAGDFKNPELARDTIEKEIIANTKMGVKAVYRLYDFDELMATFDPEKLDIDALMSKHEEGEDEGSQGGKGSSASFRPTPLNTSPRPPGTPAKWNKDADEDDEDASK